MKNCFLFSILSLLLGSCVSVNLPGGKVTPAKDVGFTAPSSPFKEIESKGSDKSWLSAKTGNTISFRSECGGAEVSLQQMEGESLAALDNLSVQTSTTTIYNARESRQTIATGTVDGVPVQLSLIVFKKNGCGFTISYGGVSAQFKAEESYFNSFKDSFKAP